eukprot:172130-Pleurochrysis_carterae.AAC.1
MSSIETLPLQSAAFTLPVQSAAFTVPVQSAAFTPCMCTASTAFTLRSPAASKLCAHALQRRVGACRLPRSELALKDCAKSKKRRTKRGGRSVQAKKIRHFRIQITSQCSIPTSCITTSA